MNRRAITLEYEKTETNWGASPLTTDYMSRPRVDRVLNQAVRNKLVYVIAGAGYGKTQVVYQC